MSNLSCGTHVAEPTANIDCRKLLNQSCRFLPKLKLPISADAKLPLTLSQFDFWVSLLWVRGPRDRLVPACRTLGRSMG